MYVCFCMLVCMYVCMRVCMLVCSQNVCMYVCVFVSLSVCMYVGMYVCMFVCLHVCVSVCMHVCMYASMCMHPVCPYDCLYVCMFVCMHVCVYVLDDNARYAGATQYAKSTCKWQMRKMQIQMRMHIQTCRTNAQRTQWRDAAGPPQQHANANSKCKNITTHQTHGHATRLRLYGIFVPVCKLYIITFAKFTCPAFYVNVGVQ